MLAVFRRELKAYFVSPIGFTFVGFFLFLTGIFFALVNLMTGNPNYTALLNGTFVFFFSLIVPLLTMRLLSEDMRQKTDQLLLTSPLGITGIVVGKFLAAVGVLLLAMVVTVIYPVIMSFYALGGLAWREILSSYIGFFLLGTAFISIGLFFSSLTDNQLVAAVTTLGTIILIWILDAITQSMPGDAMVGLVFLVIVAALLVLVVYLSTRNTPVTIMSGALLAAAIILLFVFSRASFEGLIGKILAWFSLIKRYNDFSMGVLGLAPIVYYISFSGVFVFLTVRLIERRRWM